MTPKEKAKELVEKYYHLFSVDLENTIDYREAKHCALIAVDEIIRTLNEDIRDLDVRDNVLLDLIEYWKQVKQILEKL